MDNILKNIQIQDDDAQTPIIKVMGVGGGGNNAVNHMFKKGIIGVDFVVVNTDNQALSISPVPTKIQIGKQLTRGRGAGNDPVKGREAALENLDDIKAVLANNTQMLFITAGMGGGTGTGAAPEIAKLAHEMDILTVGIVTRPFSFEGRLRKEHAEQGIEELRKYCDSLIIISNDKIREHYGNLPLSEAFGKADDILTTAAKGIAEIITVPGYINVDFEDVKTTMKGSGTAIMSTGIAEGEKRAQIAIEAAINSPLLEDIDLQDTRKILLYIASGEEELRMDEISDITEYIQYVTGGTADIIWGNGTDMSLGKAISVTIIATQFQNQKFEKKSNPQIIPMEEPKKTEKEKNETFILTTKTKENPVVESKEIKIATAEMEKPMQANNELLSSQEEMLEKKKHIESNQAERLKQLNSFSLTNIDITKYEQVPAFLRKGIKLQEGIPSDANLISSFSITLDQNNTPKLKENNSFLHDNVD